VRAAKLQGVIEFPPAGIYAKADAVFGLIATHIIQAVSVGFIPLARPKSNDLGGVDFSEQELVELSIVNCPANTEAYIDRQAMTKWLATASAMAGVMEPVNGTCAADGYTLGEDGLCPLTTPSAKDIVFDLDDAEVVLDLDNLSPSLASWVATREQRRGEPFQDPFTHHDIVADISPDDLRAVLRTIVRDTVAATVKAEIAKAFSLARGRVD
jgi:hypothetical protein